MMAYGTGHEVARVRSTGRGSAKRTYGHTRRLLCLFARRLQPAPPDRHRHRNVRRALAYATNRKEIIDKVAARFGIAGRYRPAAEAVVGVYDRHRALSVRSGQGQGDLRRRRLEDRAGRSPREKRTAAGVHHEHADGVELRQRRCRRSCRRRGATSACRPTSRTTRRSQFFDNSTNGILQGGHYDVARLAWLAAADPDDSAIYSGDNLAPHGQNAMIGKTASATAAMNGRAQDDRRAAAQARLRHRAAAAGTRRAHDHHELLPYPVRLQLRLERLRSVAGHFGVLGSVELLDLVFPSLTKELLDVRRCRA